MPLFYLIQFRTMKDNTLNLETTLKSFRGTSHYYEYKFLNCTLRLTEGAYFFASEAKAFWLMDLILSYQWNPKFRNLTFQKWKIVRSNDFRLIVNCLDGNGIEITRQVIPGSDFPLESFTLYVVDRVCLLPSEY